MIFSRLLEQMERTAGTEAERALLQKVGEKFRMLVFLRLADETHLWFPDLGKDISLEDIVKIANFTDKEELFFTALYEGFISQNEEPYYCTHQELAEAMWPGSDKQPEDPDMAISQTAKRVRNKISAAKLPLAVQNKIDIGYRLIYAP